MTKRILRDAEYYKAEPGEWVQMSLLPHANYDKCCDCGLVHQFFFELRPVTRGRHKGEMTLWRRMFRHEEATLVSRRQREKRKKV